MQKVLVTGGAGFIGSHLCKSLLDGGYGVICLDNLVTGNRKNIEGLTSDPSFEFLELDVIKPSEQLTNLSVDYIFHLASPASPVDYQNHSEETLLANSLGTLNILELAKKTGVKVLITSTSEVYGKGCAIPFRENDDVVLGPTNSPRWSYAAAKMVDEFLALAYHREYGLPVRIVRLFNTVGPRQTGRYGMVLPTFVAQAKVGGPITIYGDGKQTRCFASVHDIVPGLIAIMESEEAAGQVVNLGSDEEIAIADLAALVQDVLGRACKVTHQSYSQAYGVAFDDMQRRVPDLTRARKLINWWPVWKTRAIVEELVRCA